MSDNDKITQAAKAIEGIVKAVPVYQDVFQPAAQEIGKGLQTVAKTIHVALAPIAALVWGYEKIKDFIENKVAEKLKNVPPERIQSPSPLVAGPLLESLRYAGHEETLRDLYANLLATSIDSETAKNAHPGFVPILQNMSPDEAKIMRLFASDSTHPLIDVNGKRKMGGYIVVVRSFSFVGKMGGCTYQDLTSNYLDNLIRLGLLEIPPGVSLFDKKLYEPLEKELEPLRNKLSKNELELEFAHKKIQLTDLGKQFCNACVLDKSLHSGR